MANEKGMQMYIYTQVCAEMCLYVYTYTYIHTHRGTSVAAHQCSFGMLWIKAESHI